MSLLSGCVGESTFDSNRIEYYYYFYFYPGRKSRNYYYYYF